MCEARSNTILKGRSVVKVKEGTGGDDSNIALSKFRGNVDRSHANPGIWDRKRRLGIRGAGEVAQSSHGIECNSSNKGRNVEKTLKRSWCCPNRRK